MFELRDALPMLETDEVLPGMRAKDGGEREKQTVKTIEEIMRTIRECQEDDETMERIRRGEGLEPLRDRKKGGTRKMENKIEIAVAGLDELKEQTEELSDIVAAMNPQVVIKKAERCTINIYTSLPKTEG